MRIPRIFITDEITPQQTLTISGAAAHHIHHVLRIKINAEIIVFNGQGGEYLAKITDIKKNNITVLITTFYPKNTESPLHIHLGQAISRGEKMEFTLQKSVELGVSEITPLFTERCGVKLNEQRLQKRLDRWQAIIINASEQSGRTQLTQLNPAMAIEEWLKQTTTAFNITLAPDAAQTFADLQPTNQALSLLIGPEGGLSPAEITQAQQHGFISLRLGPRILRTETAALTAISIMQQQWGDLN